MSLDTPNPGPTPDNSPEEMSTDSENGVAQHIEDIARVSSTTSSTDATITNSPESRRRVVLTPPHRNARFPRWPPYPFRPSDQERLIRNATETYLISLIAAPNSDSEYHIVNAELATQPATRPPHRSRDSGYDADESNNVTDTESESESSEEGRARGAAGETKNHREVEQMQQDVGVDMEVERVCVANGENQCHQPQQQNATITTNTGDDTVME